MKSTYVLLVGLFILRKRWVINYQKKLTTTKNEIDINETIRFQYPFQKGKYDEDSSNIQEEETHSLNESTPERIIQISHIKNKLSNLQKYHNTKGVSLFHPENIHKLVFDLHVCNESSTLPENYGRGQRQNTSIFPDINAKKHLENSLVVHKIKNIFAGGLLQDWMLLID